MGPHTSDDVAIVVGPGMEISEVPRAVDARLSALDANLLPQKVHQRGVRGLRAFEVVLVVARSVSAMERSLESISLARSHDDAVKLRERVEELAYQCAVDFQCLRLHEVYASVRSAYFVLVQLLHPARQDDDVRVYENGQPRRLRLAYLRGELFAHCENPLASVAPFREHAAVVSVVERGHCKWKAIHPQRDGVEPALPLERGRLEPARVWVELVHVRVHDDARGGRGRIGHVDGGML